MSIIGIPRSKAKNFLLLFLFVFVTSFAGVNQVSAFSETFPDSADTDPASGYSDQPNIYAVSTENKYVTESDADLRVWFPTSSTSGSISIYNGHFCDSNAYDYMETGSWSDYGNGANITRFHVYRAGVTIASGDGSPSSDEDRYGKKNPSAGCGQVLTFNISNLDGAAQENGYYYVNLDVNFASGTKGAMNYYKIIASGGAYVGLRGNENTGAGGGHSTTQEQVDAAPEFVDYRSVFGTPCDISTNTTATVVLFDMDNAGGSGAQDPRRDVTVRVYDVTGASAVAVPWNDGTYVWTPQGDNTRVSKNFTAKPGRKYRLELNNVYRNNTVQWAVPYSQIFRKNCSWNLTGSALISSATNPTPQTGTINVRRGTSATFHFAVTRSGAPAANIDITEQWTAGNSGNIQTWTDYDFGPNWADNYVYTIPAGATPGTDYCARVIHRPRSSTDGNAEGSNIVCANATEATMSAIINLTPDDTPTNYVEPGETVTAEAAINNTGTSAGNIQYLHEMWFETGARDNTYDTDDLAYQTTNWQNRTVGAGSTPVVNTFSQSTSSPPANAAYVCSRLQIRRQAGDTSIISVGSVAKCVPIGKSPSLAVPNGSVRTGGNYGSGTCRVSLPVIASANYSKYQHYFGVLGHKYQRDVANPHHMYVADSVLSVGDIDNVVSMKAGIGTGKDTRLHFARGPGPDLADDNVVGGGQFYGSFSDIDDADGATDNVFGENPFRTHCLTALFDATRYPAAKVTDPDVSTAAPYELPAPVAIPAGSTNSVQAVTLNFCGDTANRLLTLTGPSGGDLVLAPGQQYIVRITQDGTGCNNYPVYVKINSNIKYSGTADTIDKLPQFVFLAGTTSGSRVNIQVDNAVTRLDGIYANRGTNTSATFLTCAQRASSATRSTLVAINSFSDCNNRLQLNGAVVLGGRLNPYRTFGHHQAGNTEPAEMFNLRADTILSDYARDHSSSQLEVVNQRELAPRF